MPEAKPARPIKDVVAYRLLVEKAESHLVCMELWSRGGHHDTAARHQHYAVALIEAMEANNCGQCGGHDAGQIDRTLSGRLEWIKARMKPDGGGHPGGSS